MRPDETIVGTNLDFSEVESPVEISESRIYCDCLRLAEDLTRDIEERAKLRAVFDEACGAADGKRGSASGPKTFGFNERDKVKPYNELTILPEYGGLYLKIVKGQPDELYIKINPHLAGYLSDSLSDAVKSVMELIYRAVNAADSDEARGVGRLYSKNITKYYYGKQLIIEVARDLGCNSALYERGAYIVLVLDESLAKSSIFASMIYDGQENVGAEEEEDEREKALREAIGEAVEEAEKSSLDAALWPLAERIFHELIHSRIFEDEDIKRRDQARCVFANYLLLKRVLYAPQNAQLRADVEERMASEGYGFGSLYGSNEYFKYLKGLVELDDAEAWRRISEDIESGLEPTTLEAKTFPAGRSTEGGVSPAPNPSRDIELGERPLHISQAGGDTVERWVVSDAADAARLFIGELKEEAEDEGVVWEIHYDNNRLPTEYSRDVMELYREISGMGDRLKLRPNGRLSAKDPLISVICKRNGMKTGQGDIFVPDDGDLANLRLLKALNMAMAMATIKKGREVRDELYDYVEMQYYEMTGAPRCDIQSSHDDRGRPIITIILKGLPKMKLEDRINSTYYKFLKLVRTAV
jgi:hypothetical protein